MDHRKSGESTSVSPGHGAEQKAFEDVPLQDLGNGGTRDVEANSNSSTLVPEAGDAQAGVQKIEAISMTWTKWGLIAAYARFVELGHQVSNRTDYFLVSSLWPSLPLWKARLCRLSQSLLRVLSTITH